MQSLSLFYCDGQKKTVIHPQEAVASETLQIPLENTFRLSLDKQPDWIMLNTRFCLSETRSFQLEIPEGYLLWILDLEGAASFNSDGMEFILSRNTFQIIWSRNAEIYFTLRKAQAYSLHFIGLPMSKVRSMAESYIQVKPFLDRIRVQKDAGLFVFPRAIPEGLRREIGNFYNSGAHNPEDHEYLKLVFLTTLCHELNEAAGSFQGDEGKTGDSGDDELFYKAVWLILQNPASRISSRCIAQTLQIGETVLNKQFRKNFRMSVSAFQEHMRIEKAKSLLTQGICIEEIIKLLEYSSLSHFSTAFHRKTGVSPTTYRKEEKFGHFMFSSRGKPKLSTS